MPSRKRNVRIIVLGLNDGGGGRAGAGAAVSGSSVASSGESGLSSSSSSSGASASDFNGASIHASGTGLLASDEAPQERVHLHELLAAHRLVEVDQDPHGQQHTGAAGVAQGAYQVRPGRKAAHGRARDDRDHGNVPLQDAPQHPRL